METKIDHMLHKINYIEEFKKIKFLCECEDGFKFYITLDTVCEIVENYLEMKNKLLEPI